MSHQPEPEKPEKLAFLVSPAERKFLERVRGLTRGKHLVILDIERVGLATITFLGEGQAERLVSLPPADR